MKLDTCNVRMKIIASEADTIYIPIGRGIREYKIEGLSEEKIYKDKYNNKYISVNIKPEESITLVRKVDLFPPKPTINPNKCLANNERFCKWRENGYIKKTVSKNIDLLNKEKVLQYINLIKKIKYSYPRTKYEYTDEILEKKLPQDCLGYHGTLCALLRCSDIPSVLDIGIRLIGNDKPHVWLWYFDREENDWNMIDINDSKENPINTSRMSITLGTTHKINSHTVSFVQYFVSEKMLEGDLKNSHKMKIEIT